MNNRIDKIAEKLANWLTYISLSLLFLLLVLPEIEDRMVFFLLAIFGGIAAYLGGLVWDKAIDPRNTNDGKPSIKITQKIRITLTITIISLAGIFADPSNDQPPAYYNGPIDVRVELEAIEEIILKE